MDCDGGGVEAMCMLKVCNTLVVQRVGGNRAARTKGNRRSRCNGVSCRASLRAPAVYCTATETSVEDLQKEFGV